MKKSEFIPERHEHILNLLEKQSKLSLSEIVEHFGVSEATARRDLNQLASEGKLRRYFGGAMSAVKSAPENPFTLRADEQRLEKERIGIAAANLVNNRDTVFLGTGSTVMQVARNLVDKEITVITNSLPVVALLADAPKITLISLGGQFRRSENSFIGHLTETAIKELYADKVIIGIHAISPKVGLSNDFLPESVTDRAIVDMGQQVIVVADHTKFDRVSTALVAPLNKVHMIVTNKGVESSVVHALEKSQIKVILVDVV